MEKIKVITEKIGKRINLIIVFYFCFCLFFSPGFNSKGNLQAKEWDLSAFDLKEVSSDDLAKEIEKSKQSVHHEINEFIIKLNQVLPEANNQIDFYLRNITSHDLILTDIIACLNQKLFHYNFSLNNPEILYQNTIQKFSISDIPSGEHLLNLKFLLQELTAEKENSRREPVKRCSFLSDAYCLHQKPIIETRVIKECSFNFDLRKNQTLSIIISFHDHNNPQMLALPSNDIEKLKVDLEVANGLYRNQEYLKCLCLIKNIERNFLGSPQTDEILFLQAECFFQLKMYHEAAYLYRQLRQKFPPSGYDQVSMLRLEMIHYLLNDYKAALAYFEQFSNNWKDEGILEAGRYIAAKSHYHLKNFHQSKLIIKEISQNSPYYPMGQYLQSLCFLQTNQHASAVLTLEKVINALSSPQPPSPSIIKEMELILGDEANTNSLLEHSYLLLGKILYQQKEDDNSLKEFEAVSCKSPLYSDALLGKGLIFVRSGQVEEVKKIINQLSEAGVENRFFADAKFSMAYRAQQNGDNKEACAYYEEMIQRCQRNISDIELIQNSPEKLENIFLSLVQDEALNMTENEPSRNEAPKLYSFLYEEIKNYPHLKDLPDQWHSLLALEKMLSTIHGLILEPMHAYQKNIQQVSRPLVNENLSYLRNAYEIIRAKKEKIQDIKVLAVNHARQQISNSLALIIEQFKEVRDRAKIEMAVVKFQDDFYPFTENRSEEISIALGQLIELFEYFIEKHPQSPYREKILFQLAENNYQKAMIEFQIQLKEAENKQNQADFLIETRPNFDQAIRIYGKILADFPHGHYTEKALYALAYAYQEEGAIILAKGMYERFTKDFPESHLVPEIYLRLGEISFDENKFREAIRYYEHAMKFGQVPEQYHHNILYKIGWSYYQQNQYEKAFDIFVSLADEYIRGNKQALVDEMNYQLAKIFSEYESTDKVKKLLSLLEGKPYHFQILKEYADIIFDQGRFEEAIDLYEWAVKRYPHHPMSPLMQSKIEKGYLTMNNPAAANKAREKLITNYGENTPWWQENKDEEAKKQVSGLIDESIRNSTLYLLELKNKEEYHQLIDFYKNNLDYLPTDEQVNSVNFFLGECLFKTDQYEKALVEYEKVVQDKNFSKFREDASYKQILCLEKVINKKQSKKQATTSVETTGTSVESKIEEWSDEDKKFIDACDYLIKNFPQHQNLPEVIYKKGELYFHKNKYDEALKSFNSLVQHFPEHPIRLSTMKMIAKTYFSQEKFDMAAEVYYQIVKDYDQILTDKSTKEYTEIQEARKNAHEMTALAKYKAAESVKSKDAVKAAEKFEATAQAFPQIQIADAALFEAADIYQAHGQNEKAQEIFSLIPARYPKSDYAPKSLLQMAIYQEKKNNFETAVQHYEKFYFDYPKLPESQKALYKAGLLYEKLENWEKVVKIFSIYQSEFRPQASLAIEIMFKRAYAMMKNNDKAKAEAAFQVVIDTYEQYKKRDETISCYFPAQAQFLIGELNLERYNSLKIKEISDTGMEQKLNLLKKVIENYGKSVDFAIVELATQAIFKMGMAMDILAKEVENLTSTSIKEEDIDNSTYYMLNIQWQQKIIEFLEKAILFHQRNLFLAKENSLHDDWIAKSQENISEDYWKMGQLHEKIYTFIKDAPLPDGLDKDEAKQYREALFSKALPYQDQAIEMYAKNTLSFLNNINYNIWVDQSYKRLAELKPKKFFRPEAQIVGEESFLFKFSDQLLIKP